MSERKRIFLERDFHEELEDKIIEANHIRTEALRTQVWHFLSTAGAKLYTNHYSPSETKEARLALSKAGFEIQELATEFYIEDEDNLLDWCLVGEEGSLYLAKSFDEIPQSLYSTLTRFEIDVAAARRISRNWLMSEEERRLYQITHQKEHIVLQGALEDALDQNIRASTRHSKFLNFYVSKDKNLVFHLDGQSIVPNVLETLYKRHKATIAKSFGEWTNKKKLCQKLAEPLFLDVEFVEKNGDYISLYKDIAKQQKFTGDADTKKRAVLRYVADKGYDKLSKIEKAYFHSVGLVCVISKREIIPTDIIFEVHNALRKKEALPIEAAENNKFLTSIIEKKKRKTRQKTSQPTISDEEALVLGITSL